MDEGNKAQREGSARIGLTTSGVDRVGLAMTVLDRILPAGHKGLRGVPGIPVVAVPLARQAPSPPGRWPRRSRSFGCMAPRLANASVTLGGRSQRALFVKRPGRRTGEDFADNYFPG